MHAAIGFVSMDIEGEIQVQLSRNHVIEKILVQQGLEMEPGVASTVKVGYG